MSREGPSYADGYTGARGEPQYVEGSPLKDLFAVSVIVLIVAWLAWDLINRGPRAFFGKPNILTGVLFVTAGACLLWLVSSWLSPYVAIAIGASALFFLHRLTRK